MSAGAVPYSTREPVALINCAFSIPWHAPRPPPGCIDPKCAQSSPTCPLPSPPAAFVAARHPGAWRETLAAILTSAPYDQFEGLLSALAGRLAAAGECTSGISVFGKVCLRAFSLRWRAAWRLPVSGIFSGLCGLQG